jgi:hypothetical protein
MEDLINQVLEGKHPRDVIKDLIESGKNKKNNEDDEEDEYEMVNGKKRKKEKK